MAKAEIAKPKTNHVKNPYVHPDYGHAYGDPIICPTGRAAWPHLVSPKPAFQAKPGEKQGDPRFCVTILLEKSDPAVKAWVKYLTEVAEEVVWYYNKGRKTVLSIDSVLNDGDEQDLEKKPFMRGCWWVELRNAKRPPIVDGKKSELPPDAIQGGMLIRGTITPLVTAHGLSFKLEALQRVRDDGTRFAGASRVGSYLDMIPEVDEEGNVAEVSEDTEAAETGSEVVEETPKAVKNGKAKALALL